VADLPPPRDLRLSAAERRFVAVLYLAIALVTLLAFVLAFTYLPHGLPGAVGGGGLVFTGLAITAYVLGLRHGFDADHIAAIDNTTRKLLHEGQRPLTVGTWFSLGHSTIVGAMIVALVAALDLVAGHLTDLTRVGSVVGLLVSGTFLFLIGLVNLLIVGDVYRIFRGLRDRTLDAAQLDAEMEQRGFLYRYFGRLFRLIRAPWQIYPVGLLFGLGFDTATEVILIALSGVLVVAHAYPLWAVLILPLLFTCGMVLSDTSDGVAMRYAYGWAFLHPIRKVYYNLTLTVISVLVAFAIGGVEILQVLATELGWSGPFWSLVRGLDFETLGLAIAVLFVVAWLVAMAIYRVRRYEELGFDPRRVGADERPPEVA
jgi:high-affinity nickel-transport protein